MCAKVSLSLSLWHCYEIQLTQNWKYDGAQIFYTEHAIAYANKF